MDNLTAREETREKSEGSLAQLTIVRGGIAKLHVNVDQLSFTDISILWGEVRFPNMPESVSERIIYMNTQHVHKHMPTVLMDFITCHLSVPHPYIPNPRIET